MKSRHCKIEDVYTSSLPNEPQVVGRGCILLCKSGNCNLRTDFSEHIINAYETIILFPTDIIQLVSASDDFLAQAFYYDEDLLREASLHLEDSVYSSLRKDRVCHDRSIVDDVISPMFRIINHFFNIEQCNVLEDIVVLQLKGFFLGFSDYLLQHPDRRPAENESLRTNELFSKFMEVLEHHFMDSRDVQYYADKLFITRKYLGIIVGRKTGKTPKFLINEYVVMQLKLTLRNSNDSIRQIASAFHFSDDSLLIRYFRSHTGMTPVQYRQSMSG